MWRKNAQKNTNCVKFNAISINSSAILTSGIGARNSEIVKQ